MSNNGQFSKSGAQVMSQLRESGRAFFRFGGQNAQFIGVLIAATAGAVYIGQQFSQILILKSELQRVEATAEANIRAARAEALSNADRRILDLGFASEQKAYRKALAAAKHESDEK